MHVLWTEVWRGFANGSFRMRCTHAYRNSKPENNQPREKCRPESNANTCAPRKFQNAILSLASTAGRGLQFHLPIFTDNSCWKSNELVKFLSHIAHRSVPSGSFVLLRQARSGESRMLMDFLCHFMRCAEARSRRSDDKWQNQRPLTHIYFHFISFAGSFLKRESCKSRE